MQTPILALAGSLGTVPSTSAARYSALAGGAAMVTYHSSINGAATPFPVAGKLTKWRVKIDVAPGSGKSWLFELMLNGSADPNFKVTIADAATEGSITLDRSIAAQDIVAMRTTPSGTPAAITVVKSSLVFEGTDTTHSVIFGGNHSVNISNSAVTYIPPGSLDASTTLPRRAMGVIASPGTISALTVYTSAAVATGSYVGELYRSTDNGANWTATGITCTVSGGGRLAFDSTHSLHFDRGDCLQLRTTPSSTPTAVELRWSCCFVPDTAGESLLFGGMTDAVNNSGDTFYHVNGVNSRTNGGTESNVTSLMPLGATAKNLVTSIETPPGASKSHTATLRVNGADTALTAAISGTTTPAVASDTTHSVALNDNDLIAIKSTASANFPTAPTSYHFGLALFISGASTASGAGSAPGTGTGSGTGAATAASGGAASGSAAATATGGAIAAAAGSAAGTGAASATGTGLNSAAGAAAATGAASAVGRSTAAGTGSAAGVGAASGAGTSTAAAAASASGAGAVSGTGAATAAVAGSTAGAGAASGTASSTAAAVGSAAGTGVASGAASSTAAAAASAAGASAAAAVGASTSAAVGSASGSGDAEASADSGAGRGDADGTGAAAGSGQATAAGAGSATGSGDAVAAGHAVNAGAGTAAGSGAAQAAAQTISGAAGSSAGAGDAVGDGESIENQNVVAAAGAAAGSGSAIAVGSFSERRKLTAFRVRSSVQVSPTRPANRATGSRRDNVSSLARTARLASSRR